MSGENNNSEHTRQKPWASWQVICKIRQNT